MGDSQSDSKIFSVRIVSIDYYMTPPIPGMDLCYSSFQGGKVNEVPVIRVYGATPLGQKTCLHVHRVLPYLYVLCSDLLLQPEEKGDTYAHLISLAIEKALKLKSNTGSKRQHVHGCSLVRGKKFYGYQQSDELFLKIYFYFPQDVPRAANLLLAGVILDKILQPYESHIPFLLQFLVDYNLYGMGLLHLEKVKFRPSVPDAFSPRTSQGHGHRSGSPIWLSSTIPEGWIWQYSSQPDSLTDQDIPLVRRQSICELEADASIDEIINQQSKLYSSLSQTHSETKMVPSLIPIWEEFERTGILEAFSSPDSEKPCPRDVLSTLADGRDFQNKLMQICSDAEKFSCSLSLSYGPSAQAGPRNVEPESEGNESMRGSRGSGINGFVFTEDFLHDEGPLSKKYEYTKQFSSEEFQTPGTVEALKATDQEALRLLKWLASSQAAEDIHSDDELAHEVILSPLLPAATISKVLEKANTDYENESQQECQDIIDSVEDLINFDDLKEKTSLPSAHKIIPQVDGSGDDQSFHSAADNSFFRKMKNEPNMSPKDQAQYDMGPKFTSKHKSKRPLCGSLPIISAQSTNDSSQAINFNKTRSSHLEIIEGIGTESKPHIHSDVLIGDTRREFCVHNETNTLVGCPMRDLMRKKRCYQAESPGLGSVDVRVAHIFDERNDKRENTTSPISNNLYADEQMEFQKRGSGLIGSVTPEVKEVHCKENMNDGHGCRIISSPISKTFCSDEQMELRDWKNCSSTFVESRYSACHAKPTHSNTATYDKLPLSSNKDSLPEKTYVDTSSQSSGEFENFISTESRMLHCRNRRLARFVCSGITGPSTCPDETACSSKDGLGSCTGHEKETAMQIELDEFEVGKSNTCLFPENLNDRLTGRDTSPLIRCISKSTDVGTVADPVELIGLTFHQRPPILESEVNLSYMSSSPGIVDGPCPCNEEKAQARGRDSNKYLPFFSRDNLERNFQDDNPLYQDTVMGVPTHYQNDGSYLFMLTPVFSPPSEKSVYEWLLHDGTATSEVLQLDVAELSSPDGSHDNQLNSQCSPISSCNEPLLEFGANLDVNSQDDKNIQQSEELKVVKMPFNNHMTMVLPNEESIFENKCSVDLQDFSQISGPDAKTKLTPLSQIGFQDPASIGAGQQLTLLSIEVHAESRGDLRPDPRFDAVNIIILAFQEDDGSNLDIYVLLCYSAECVQRNLNGIHACRLFISVDEVDLFSHFVKIICSCDPDIILGWDIQSSSLGFLAERAAHLGIGLLNKISRTPYETSVSSSALEVSQKGLLNNALSESLAADPSIEETIIGDEWGRTHASGVHVGGRIVLNMWRLMRSEVKLNMYTAEAVTEAVLRRKVPSIHSRVLTKWFTSGPAQGRYRCIEYVLQRAKLNFQIMKQLDLISRTSELARVFGIDFFSVLSRGSQYRVESMFLRLAHTQNYLAISPGTQQVASQPAMECLPLVMEPESGFYSDPVVVLDFQSLYPSMIIAYNLCFCTCLGKVTPAKANTLGVSSYSPDLNILRGLKEGILLTPNGVMYVPSKVRKGILPRLLEEILSTRIMVKQAMKKLASSQQVLHRIFNARQLALKLIANVTYGYTAAGFSGRMPCAELADSIVQCGRRTLENAILLVNTNEKWKAKVIYGDTDSMFVLLEGRTLKEAFCIGKEIAAAVTAMNPNPVTLKMEKVYLPCFLLTKKRYVGYSYESPDQIKPTFDAKGIETVRRDTCGAVSKVLEQSLRLYFEHQDASKVKDYVLRQWTRILSGRISLKDFIFAKEVRLGTYSARATSLPPAAIVAMKAMKVDPRAEPRYAERIPYVVVHGEPGARLVDLVVDPHDLLALDSPFRLNDIYYIRKQMIPVLQRVFGLIGADLNQWFSDLPRPGREAVGKRKFHLYASNQQRRRIDYYYLSKHCILCGDMVQGSVHFCGKCAKNEVASITVLTGKVSKLERELQHLAAICRHCGGGDWLVESGVKCTSLACSVFFERKKVQGELRSFSVVAAEKGIYPQCMVEWF